MPRGMQLKSDRTAVPALRLAILFIYPLLWSYTPAQASMLSGGAPADNAGEPAGSDSGPHKAVEAEKEDDAVVAEGAATMSYLVAVMEEVAESVKAEFKSHPADADPQQRGLFENQYDFVEFRTRFREKFVQRLKQNEEAKSRKTFKIGLARKHIDLPGNAIRNVTDFLGQGYIKPDDFDNYFRFERPAALQAIPLRIVKELWREEIPKRRKAWEDEGKMLFVAEADKNLDFVGLYNERQDSVEPFLRQWVSKYPLYPLYLQQIEEERVRDPKDHLNWLAQHYTKPGGGSQWKRIVREDGWVVLSAV
eukprot:g1360.t1